MRNILLQLDTDNHPSSFDSVTAIDSGVDHLLRYANVEPLSVEPLIHGAMFTRGGDGLRHSAIFVGGSNVSDAEELFRACQSVFFDSMRVSILLDANGCNTTASAAVVSAMQHCELDGNHATILGGTGPVGRRIAQLLAISGCQVVLTSRSAERAQQAAHQINEKSECQFVRGMAMNTQQDAAKVCADASLLFACGAAGVELIDKNTINGLGTLKVAVDLNAVPPVGIAGLAVADRAKPIGNGNAVGYGAIAVGGLKMKAHRAAVQSLFEQNDRVLDCVEVFEITKSIALS